MKSLSHGSRFSFRIFGLLVAFALTAGMAAMPHPLQAQSDTPAAQSVPTESGAGANAEKQSSEASNDVFRHAPIVQSIAKMLHMDVEITARILEFLNFGIIVLGVGIPLVRIMPRIIRQRSQTLKHDLEEARKTTADANVRLSAIEAKLSGLDKEIAEIRKQVEEEAKNDEARIKASIGEESSRIVATAEQEITAAAAHARRGLRNFAADLAIDQAAKQLVLTPETDRALIAEFVSEAGRNGSAGGQN